MLKALGPSFGRNLHAPADPIDVGSTGADHTKEKPGGQVSHSSQTQIEMPTAALAATNSRIRMTRLRLRRLVVGVARRHRRPLREELGADIV